MTLDKISHMTCGRKNLIGFSLQLITNGTGIDDTIAGARAALEGGCRWVQLRMKDATDNEIIEAGLKLRRLADLHGATFIIDDHAELVETVGADGVHLGKNDLPPDEARKLLGPSKIIGATANTFADIRLATSRGADYIGLGPFRFTTTKKNLSPVLGIEGYRSIMHECRCEGLPLPIVAIGGITLDDIPPILSTGVSGVAASGALLATPFPAEETAKWVETIEKTLIKTII